MKMKIWLIVALLPAIGLAAPTKSEPPSTKTGLLTSVPPMKPVMSCISKPQPSLATQVRIRVLAKMPGLFLAPFPAAGLRKAHTEPPVCTTTHYRMYTAAQRVQVVNSCYNHKVYATKAPAYANCSLLAQDNSTLDALLPELVNMRKQYTEKVNKFNTNRATDDDRVTLCFRILTNAALSRTYGFNCHGEFEASMDPSMALKANMTRRQQYRQKAFEERMVTYCSNIGHTPDLPLNGTFSSTHQEHLHYCEKIHLGFAWSCLNRNYNLSDDAIVAGCKAIESGPVDALKEKHLAQLHDLYNGIMKTYSHEQNIARHCFEQHRNDQATQCQFLNWDRRIKPKSQMEEKVIAFYDCLVSKEKASRLTNSTIVCN